MVTAVAITGVREVPGVTRPNVEPLCYHKSPPSRLGVKKLSTLSKVGYYYSPAFLMHHGDNRTTHTKMQEGDASPGSRTESKKECKKGVEGLADLD
jgi:hypothetical protein